MTTPIVGLSKPSTPKTASKRRGSRACLRTEVSSSFLQPLGVNGPQLGIGLLPTNPQRMMVHADQAEDARILLADTLVENEQGIWPEVGYPFNRS